MGKKYTAPTSNLATLVIDGLPPHVLGSCDPFCDMNLKELGDFWWTYCHNLISRLPTRQANRHDPLNRLLETDAQTLLDANNATANDFMQRRAEPRLGHVALTKFGLVHLLPALAERISPELKVETMDLVREKYGNATPI